MTEQQLAALKRLPDTPANVAAIAAAERKRFAKSGAAARWSGETKARSKMGNIPVVVDGVGRFASQGEAERWHQLVFLQSQHQISGLRRQVPFALSVNGMLIGTYVSDFFYVELGVMTANAWRPHQRPRRVVEDWKSPASKTDLYEWKKKHLLAEHGIAILETGC